MSHPLLAAVAAGDAPAAQAALAAGADPGARGDDGATALMHAAHAGNLALVRLLLAAGADVNAADAGGWTALHKAVHNADADRGYPDVVQALVDAGADVLARNDGGLTALMMVKEKFYVDVINLLTEAERDAGVSEGSCATKHAPGSSVITFRKPLARS